MRKKGFTLIELLVVIAIIAILAAILFPVFAKARDKARSAACLANVKQINLAVVQYSTDYDETYPLGGVTILESGTYYVPFSTYTLLDPYIKNQDLWTCPNEGRCDGLVSFWEIYDLMGWPRGGPDILYPNHYFVNAAVMPPIYFGIYGGADVDTPEEFEAYIRDPANGWGDDADYLIGMPAKVGAVQDPSGLACMYDFYHYQYNGGFMWLSTYLAVCDNPSWHTTWGVNRHNEGSNYGFCDGHVKWGIPGVARNWTIPSWL